MTYSFYRAFGVTLPVLSMVVTGALCNSGTAAGSGPCTRKAGNPEDMGREGSRRMGDAARGYQRPAVSHLICGVLRASGG